MERFLPFENGPFVAKAGVLYLALADPRAGKARVRRARWADRHAMLLQGPGLFEPGCVGERLLFRRLRRARGFAPKPARARRRVVGQFEAEPRFNS